MNKYFCQVVYADDPQDTDHEQFYATKEALVADMVNYNYLDNEDYIIRIFEVNLVPVSFTIVPATDASIVF